MQINISKGLRQVCTLLAAGVLLVACDSGAATPTATSPTTESSTPTALAAATSSVATVQPTTGVSDTPTTGATGNMTKVRLGYVPVMIFAPIYVAKERGYFAKEGIDVELTPVQGGSDSVVQLAAGNFDAAVGGVGAGLFNAANRGVKFTIVAPMHSEQPPLTSPLVISAKRAGEIKTVADLKGKKVSINATGAATEYWLDQALEKNGLTMSDIQLTTVSFGNVPAALESGSLDAAILGEPLATINADKGITKVLANDFINGFYSTYLYMGDPLLKSNPQVAQGFVRAYLHACRDLQGNYVNQDFATIVEKYTKVPASVILRASPAQYEPNGKIPVKDIQTLQDYFIKRGEVDYKQPLDVTKFIDQSVADQAAKTLDAQK